MNHVITHYVNSLKSISESLKKNTIFLDKSWVLLDNEGEIQILIFKRNNELILSKHGKVVEGFWEYLQGSHALLIDIKNEKLLLKEQFIDSNAMIFKLDSNEIGFFTLINEKVFPDFNILAYLNSLKIKKFGIKEIPLIDGRNLQIYNSRSTIHIIQYLGKTVEAVDSRFAVDNLMSGCFMSKNRELTFHVTNNKIEKVHKNQLINSVNGEHIEIEEGEEISPKLNVLKTITSNGQPLTSSSIIDSNNIQYEVSQGKITKVNYLVQHRLKNGGKIKIKQRERHTISEGDTIIFSNPINPLPDGKYKIKGKWLKIHIENGIVV